MKEGQKLPWEDKLAIATVFLIQAVLLVLGWIVLHR